LEPNRNWEKRKQQLLDYIRANSGKYNGAEISYKLNIFSIKELKKINGHYVGYFKELEQENKIQYDYHEQKWYAKTTLDQFTD
jgi:hypothetical protein